MNISKPIYWHEGIFLQAQHFQYADAFHAEALSRVATRTRIGSGGVDQIAILSERLQAGIFACSELQAFMPDGTWIDIRQNARVKDRDVKHLLKRDGVYDVAVSLPILVVGRSALSADGQDGRFEEIGYGEELPDLYGSGSNQEVERLTLHLKYLIGDEIAVAKDAVVMPLARLIVEAGQLRIDETYSPPCLHIAAQEHLAQRLKQIVELLQTRELRLSEMARPWGRDVELIDSAYLLDRLIHTEIAQILAELQHDIGVQADPVGVFKSLVIFIKRISAVGGIKCPEVPLWNSLRTYALFNQLGEIIEGLLSQLSSGPDSVVTFDVKSGWLEAQIPAVARIGQHTVYLVVGDVTETQLLQASPAKLAAISRIETIVSRALPGVSLERLDRVPYGLHNANQAAVWRVDTNDDNWKDVNHSGTVCLHWLGLPRSASPKLIFFRA
jgi:type VI secretion system protein ImpJ